MSHTEIHRERFQSLFNGLNEPVLVHEFGEDGFDRFLEVNDAACQRYGYTREEFLQLSPADIDDVRTQSANGEWPFRESLLRAGGGVYEAVHVTRSGRSFPVEISARISRHLDRDVIIAIARDISVRRRTEEQRRIFERILATNDDLLSFVDDRFVYRAVNDAYLQAHARSRDEIIGHPVAEVLGSRVYEETVLPLFLRTMKGETTASSFWFDFAGRGRRFIDAKYHPYRDPGGKVTGIVVAVHDATDRVRAEASLVESEERLKLALQGADLGLWDWDIPSGRVVFNERWARMVGFRPDQLDPNIEAWLERVHPDDKPFLMDRLQAHLRGDIDMFAVEHRVRTRDGGWTWILDRGRVIERDADGKPLRMAGTHLDITERVQVQQDQERLRHQLAETQKVDSIGRLAGGVAHDFNNMLTVILGHLGQAIRKLPDEHPARGDLQRVKTAAQRSAGLTQQLLAYARRQPILPRVLDLNEAVSGTLDLLERSIGERIELLWEPQDRLWAVRMDPGQVVQILTNLCLNARDAIEEFGTIRIAARNRHLEDELLPGSPVPVRGEYVEVTVADDGCGMTAEVLAEACEPFFTTKARGEGTGLGLSSVHGIVSQNDGFLEIESEPGRGTRVRILLPRYEGAPPAVGAEEALILRAPGSRGTALLVEDEDLVLELSRRMLEQLGFRVLAFESPQQALECAARPDQEVHLLVTDIVMPGLNGENLARRLREIHPAVRILFMSGYSSDIITQQEILAEGAMYLAKPFEQEELAERVQELMDD